jgi:cytochrome c peroxidase
LWGGVAHGSEPAPHVARVAALSVRESATLDEVLGLVSQAAERNAQYIAVAEWRMPAPEAITGPTISRFAEMARGRAVWIAVPIAEASGKAGRHFETTVLLNPRGEVAAHYRKILTTAERGSPYEVLESVPDGDRRIGILAGDDIQTGVARLSARGAATVLITTSWESTGKRDWSSVCQDLSREYGVNLAVAARDPHDTAIYTPAAARAAADASGIAFAALIDPSPAVAAPLGLPPVPTPSSYHTDSRLIELGRRLFFDPSFSSTKQVSCATCHNPLTAFASYSRKAPGVDGSGTRRNVPSVLNVAYRGVLFWDGLSSSLESQAKFPMTHTHEMNRHYLDAVADIRTQPPYRELFREIGRPNVEYDDIAAALAAYQRSLVSGGSAFDRYLYGGDQSAMGEAARRGLALFRGKAGCAACHVIGSEYALLMDQEFHNTGVAYNPAAKTFSDTGFGAISYQGVPGLFLTPSLRNVARTAPYMHDGSLATLRDVVEFYDRGGRPNPYLDPRIKPLHLSQQESLDLVAFLEALTGANAYSSDGRRLPAGGTVAALDFTPQAGDVAANRRRIASLVEQIAASGAALVVVPENAEAGGTDAAPPPAVSSSSPAYWSALAKRNRIWIVTEAPEVLASGRTYLRSLCIDPQGRIAGTFRKSTLDARDTGVSAGDFRTLTPVDTQLGRIGFLSGSDLVRGVPRLAARGARLIAVSTSWSAQQMAEWSDVIRQLEAESGVTVLMAGVGAGSVRRVAWTMTGAAASPALGLPPFAPPSGAAVTTASIELGQRLFTEISLSRDGRVSCTTCHDPAKAFAGSEPSTHGVFGRVNKGHAPSLLNNAFRLFQTWEGRVERPEDQIRNALLGFSEMDMTEDTVVAAVAAKPSLRELVRNATGKAEPTFEDITTSLANYTRTLISGDSPFDRYYFGHDQSAISPAARRGLEVFRGKAGCASCHKISAQYAMFTDDRFHNTGVGYRRFFSYLGYSGNGVEGNLVTRNKARGEYLTPSLRNVAVTAPYMHDGGLATLRDVVQYYNRGGRPNPFLDSRLRPLHLAASEQEDLVRFLESLTGTSTTIPFPNQQGATPNAAVVN